MSLEIGTKVVLKGCPYGQPGTVIHIERNRAVVLWHDLDYMARHRPESLTVIGSGEIPVRVNTYLQVTAGETIGL